jgi:hypothetical protein
MTVSPLKRPFREMTTAQSHHVANRLGNAMKAPLTANPYPSFNFVLSSRLKHLSRLVFLRLLHQRTLRCVECRFTSKAILSEGWRTQSCLSKLHSRNITSLF